MPISQAYAEMDHCLSTRSNRIWKIVIQIICNHKWFNTEVTFFRCNLVLLLKFNVSIKALKEKTKQKTLSVVIIQNKTRTHKVVEMGIFAEIRYVLVHFYCNQQTKNYSHNLHNKYRKTIKHDDTNIYINCAISLRTMGWPRATQKQTKHAEEFHRTILSTVCVY